MTQLDHCVLANEILGPVLSCRSVHFKMASNFEEMLASAVENLPILYDKSLKEFKDNNKKKNAWQKVAQQLGLESGE